MSIFMKRIHITNHLLFFSYQQQQINSIRSIRSIRCIVSVPNNCQEILNEISDDVLPFRRIGSVANYIPELAKVDPSKFGMHVKTVDGSDYAIGDSNERFSIQSISKVFSFTLALSKMDEKIFERVRIEPSGTAFNSLIQLELEQGIPRNPFINAGAIVICDVLMDQYKNPKAKLLEFVRMLSRNPTIDFNPIVAESERRTGYRNRALVNFLKSFGNIHHDVTAVLDLYFHMCSIEMSCQDLATAFMIFANEGTCPPSGNHPELVVLTPAQTKRVNAIMSTCGFYDEAGEFAYSVGLPGKSGVGGGIVAVHPRRYAVASWGPRLNSKGNSVMGFQALAALTKRFGTSIY